MSKHNNQNRDHYVQAGRDRQSDPRLQGYDKAQLGQSRHHLRENATRNFIPGAAPVGEKNDKGGDE